MTNTPNFGRFAQLYARVRPGYLPQVFDDLIALSGIPEGGRILEIGPGTGQATIPLLQRGYHVTGIEPDAALAEEARRTMPPNADLALHVSRFEDWPLSDKPFDLVLAATAFHWLDPGIRYMRSAAALRPAGSLAIVNTHHVAGGIQAFFDAVQACYAAHMPSNAPTRRLRTSDEIMPDNAGLIGSGLFDEPAVRRYDWEATYTAREYTDLLSTYSDHIALSEAARGALFACITALIEGRFGGQIAKQYMTELFVARKL